MAEYNLGRVAFFDKGVFSLTETYNKWDFVVTSDSTYLFIGETPQIGKPVTDTNFWKCIANGKPATLAAAAAEVATQAANTAATNADNARLAIQTDLGLKLDKSAVKQAIGASTTDVMSQNAVTVELAAKEVKSNKQNSLAADGTGTKFPTVDAVNAGLGAKADVVQGAWITPTLLNGHTFAPEPLRYRKNQFGRVEFKGGIKSNGNSTIFILPVGYRPTVGVDFLIVRNGWLQGVYCGLNTGGDLVFMSSVVGNNYYFNQVSILTD